MVMKAPTGSWCKREDNADSPLTWQIVRSQQPRLAHAMFAARMHRHALHAAHADVADNVAGGSPPSHQEVQQRGHDSSLPTAIVWQHGSQ